MYHMSVEDLEILISSIENDVLQEDNRKTKLKMNKAILMLKEIHENAMSICWYTGYAPKVSLSEDIAITISEIKNLTVK